MMCVRFMMTLVHDHSAFIVNHRHPTPLFLLERFHRLCYFYNFNVNSNIIFLGRLPKVDLIV